MVEGLALAPEEAAQVSEAGMEVPALEAPEDLEAAQASVEAVVGQVSEEETEGLLLLDHPLFKTGGVEDCSRVLEERGHRHHSQPRLHSTGGRAKVLVALEVEAEAVGLVGPVLEVGVEGQETEGTEGDQALVEQTEGQVKKANF